MTTRETRVRSVTERHIQTIGLWVVIAVMGWVGLNVWQTRIELAKLESSVTGSREYAKQTDFRFQNEIDELRGRVRNIEDHHQ